MGKTGSLQHCFPRLKLKIAERNRRRTKDVNVHQKASIVTTGGCSLSIYPLPSYTLTSVKVIMFDRTVATHAMVCTATGRTRHESAAIAARFFGVCCSCWTGPLAVVMA